MSEKLRILCIGAHPDDCEFLVGGSAILWAAQGHTVRLVSATDGQTGHYNQGGVVLAQRRIAEAKAAAALLGAESLVLPIPNGQIEPVMIYRWMFIRMIRQFNPDLILTHRPNDYHPDHRYTSQLVMDSAYVVTVPNDCADTPAMKTNPVIGYFADRFRKPCPFEPTVAIDISSVIARKFDALHCHQSQQYEWLPYNKGQLDQVPADDKGRRQWLFEQRSGWDAQLAEKYRPLLIERYGPQRGPAVKYAEAFEGCEYGTPMNQTQIQRLFAGL